MKRTAKQYTSLLVDVQRLQIIGALTDGEAKRAFRRVVKLADAAGFNVVRVAWRDYRAVKK